MQMYHSPQFDLGDYEPSWERSTLPATFSIAKFFLERTRPLQIAYVAVPSSGSPLQDSCVKLVETIDSDRVREPFVRVHKTYPPQRHACTIFRLDKACRVVAEAIFVIHACLLYHSTLT